MADRVQRPGLGEWSMPALRLSRKGRVVEASRGICELLGTSGAQLLGLTGAQVQEQLRRGSVSPFELRLEDGERLLLVPDREAQDLRHQVRHLSRLATLGRLVSSVVHEINNALSGISGYAQLLLEADLPDAAKADLQCVYEESLRAAKVAHNLLRFSRAGSEEKALVSLADVLGKCAELKRRDLTLKSIELRLLVAPDLPGVLGNESLIFQVFLNLLTNAEQSIASLRRGGQIQVSAARQGSRVVVHVRDDGPGVPAERSEQIFSPFYTSRPPGEGSGLGLSICREVMTEHDGSIRLVPGRRGGAHFEVAFPAAPRQVGLPAPSAAESRPRVPLRNRRIVLIEDEPAQREVVTRALSGHGNRVVAFERGDDALPYLLREPIDLVISDLHRPGLSGIALFESVRSERPALARRFLFLTGDIASKETERFLRQRGTAVLRKPIDIGQLLRRAHALVRRGPGARPQAAATAPRGHKVRSVR